MSKIFIDCGGNIGQSVELFKKTNMYDKSFKIYSFEPLKELTKQYKSKDVHLIQRAVWINDGEIEFFISRKYNCGNTIFKNKVTGNIDKEHPVRVPCIDFSNWMLKNFSSEDYIILKMDIEGAEYKVLNKMIVDKSINMVKKLYMEFHYDKIKLDKNIHNTLVSKLRAIKGLELFPELGVCYKELRKK